MVQGAKRELTDWFKNTVEDFQKWEEQMILHRIANMYKRSGPEVEKKIFKYVARYSMDRLNPPSTIEGLPSEYPMWEPLNPSWIKRKGHRRKWRYSGNLQKYLAAKDDATYWYRKPQVKIDYKNKIVTYLSMFREGRKKLTAKDYGRKTPVSQEQKIQFKKAEDLVDRDGDNALRPLIKLMEKFLLYQKLNKIMDERLKQFMEEDYEGEQLIPTANEF